MRRLFSVLRLAAAGALALAPGACVSLPEGTNGAPELSTHVEDWRDEVVYQLLVDRFANGDVNNDYQVQPSLLGRYQGGDWKGVEEHLGYLEELGVTTLWISPIVRNVETDADVDAYHGYWAQDLAQTNPHFGDINSLRSMINAAHARSMKVVLDIVTNHMGQVFFYDINHNGKADIYVGGTGTTSDVTRVSEFDPDWDPNGVQSFSAAGLAGPAPIVFIQDTSINRVPPPQGILGTARGYHGKGRILNYDEMAQTMLGDFPGGLKDVATEVPEVRQQMIESYTRWVELLDLDGFRIDTVKHVEHEFWSTFAPAVRQRLAPQGKNNFLMFGEAFDGNDELLGSYTVPGELDSVFNFSQHYSVFRDVFMYARDPKLQKGTNQIEENWASRAKNWSREPQPGGVGIPPNRMPVNFIDNHDVARFLFENGDKAALRNALTLLGTEEGIPCIYYGTEQDFAGGNDPANREILWYSGFNTTGDTFRHLAKVLRLRKQYSALRRGSSHVVWSSPAHENEEDAGMFGFERVDGADYALVVLNTSSRKTSSTGPMQVAQRNAKLVDVLGPKREEISTDGDGRVRVTLPPQSAAIFVPASRASGQ